MVSAAETLNCLCELIGVKIEIELKLGCRQGGCAAFPQQTCSGLFLLF